MELTRNQITRGLHKTQSFSVSSSSRYGRILSLPLLAMLLTGCDPVSSISRSLTFEGALSKDCLIQSAIAIDHTLEETKDDLEARRFPYKFLVRSNTDNGLRWYTWYRSEPQEIYTFYQKIGGTSRPSELSFCKETAEYLTSVQLECMLQPETTKVTESFIDASC